MLIFNSLLVLLFLNFNEIAFVLSDRTVQNSLAKTIKIIEKNKQLIKKYIQRTTHGYEKMLDANTEIKNYREYQHQFRDFDKKRNVGPPAFYYRSCNDKQRINNALKRNENLDEVPFFNKENPTNHQFRQNKSQYNFKYTSFDTASRVMETMQNMKTNQVPTSWDLNVKSYLKTQRQSRYGDRSLIERNVKKKTILPSLNLKHHPKSLQSIKNKLTLGPLKNAIIQNKMTVNHSQGLNKLRETKKPHLTVKFSTFHVRTQTNKQIKFQ